MQYEVELKFPLSDPSEVLSILNDLNALPGCDEAQVDQYFAHPVRDFSVTDEALRIRSIGDENRVTYKGPVVDRSTKTRHESELEFAAGSAAAEQLAQIWEHLGFRRVRIVRKQRQTYQLTWLERSVSVCLDQVAGLGSFLEIEIVADHDSVSAAQQAILALAANLKLSRPERRSYLELLLERDRDSSGPQSSVM